MLPARILNRLNVALACGVALLCLAYPRMDGDAAVYALLAKHMVQHNDWANLVYHGQDWLDKPHFPFWMVALSFELFGINERAYLAPGLVLYALGGWWTSRVALTFYTRDVAALAAWIYLGLFGIVLATSDQKAEVYLLGLVPGASLAWLRFAQTDKPGELQRHGLLAALLTACALMSKGVFLLAVVGVGAVATLLIERGWRHLLHWKWLLAALACALFTAPELLSLYWQFDSQPDKTLFGRTGVSGLRFFFWDGQFGRFLNTGPIQNRAGSPWFFVHNMSWTFFPWFVFFLATLVASLRAGWARLRGPVGTPLDPGAVFLWTTLALVFGLFSVTRYQMDYYLVIAYPFAAVLCARWLVAQGAQRPRGWDRGHLGVAVFFGLFALVCTLFVAGLGSAFSIGVLALLLVSALVLGRSWARLHWLARSGAVGLLACLCLFGFAQKYHRQLYEDYSLGYAMARGLAQAGLPPQQLYLYQVESNTYDFLSAEPVVWAQDEITLARQLAASDRPWVYVAVYADAAPALVAHLERALARALDARTALALDERILPKQFIKQVFKRDAALEQRSVQILRLNLAGSARP